MHIPHQLCFRSDALGRIGESKYLYHQVGELGTHPIRPTLASRISHLLHPILTDRRRYIPAGCHQAAELGPNIFSTAPAAASACNATPSSVAAEAEATPRDRPCRRDTGLAERATSSTLLRRYPGILQGEDRPANDRTGMALSITNLEGWEERSRPVCRWPFCFVRSPP